MENGKSRNRKSQLANLKQKIIPLFLHTSPPLGTLTHCGGAGGLVVLAGFKPVAGLREAAWVGSIPTRLRQLSLTGRLDSTPAI